MKIVALTHPYSNTGIRYLSQIKTLQDLGIRLVFVSFGGVGFFAERVKRQLRIMRRKGVVAYVQWRQMRRQASVYKREVEEQVDQLWNDGLFPRFDLRIDQVFNGFSNAAIRYIQSENPEFLYQVGAGIIPKHFIEQVPPILNLHPAILPGVRGHDPVFWTHYYGLEACLGSTLHLIDERIDTGQPLLRMRFEPKIGIHYADSIKRQIIMERELLKLFFNNYPDKYAQYDMGGSNISIYRSFWSRQQYEELQKANWWKARDI